MHNEFMILRRACSVAPGNHGPTPGMSQACAGL